jgi:signal transduction histidine kinase
MRERVEMLEGSFAVTSTPGKQTTVRVVIPVAAAPSHAKRPRRHKAIS